MAQTAKLRDVPAQMLATGAAAEAAKRLAKQLGPPRSHSVWVRNELGPEKFDGATPIPRTITPVICVAKHPRFGVALVVPRSFEGFAVREEDWA